MMSSTNNLSPVVADLPEQISAPTRLSRSHLANWVILMPVFGTISVIAGWPHVVTRRARVGLIVALALCWAALLLSVWLLFSGGVRGVLNANASSLAMMTLLALGTFVAGVQARVWRICAVGIVLFAAVPGLGWLDQSPLMWTVATIVIVAIGAAVWWVMERPTTLFEKREATS
jgi:hypothetical protein